jgi:hypothetical protein
LLYALLACECGALGIMDKLWECQARKRFDDYCLIHGSFASIIRMLKSIEKAEFAIRTSETAIAESRELLRCRSFDLI